WLRLDPPWAHTLVLLVGFGGFFFLGMEAYVVSLANVRHYLRREGLARFTFPVIATLHALSAGGGYLGRAPPLTAWALLGDGSRVLSSAYQSLLRPWPLALVAFTFVVTVTASEVLLRVNRFALARVGAHRGGH